jgi:hypothetical protein
VARRGVVPGRPPPPAPAPAQRERLFLVIVAVSAVIFSLIAAEVIRYLEGR